MRYKIEFELPDNSTVQKEIKHASVSWGVWGYSGIAKATPSIDTIKHGRWVPGREIGKEILTDGTTAVVYEDYRCSSCGLILFRLLHNSDGTPFYKFCPNCGADMRGESDG